MELGACFVVSLLWAPLVFVPLHYFTQGYLTSIGNLLTLAVYQFPVNAIALYGASLFQNFKAGGSTQHHTSLNYGPTVPADSSSLTAGAAIGEPKRSTGRRE